MFARGKCHEKSWERGDMSDHRDGRTEGIARVNGQAWSRRRIRRDNSPAGRESLTFIRMKPTGGRVRLCVIS